MGVTTQIEDGQGSGRSAQVTPSNALLVQSYPSVSGRGLSVDQLTAIRLLREFVVTSAGASSMIVNGSTTPVDFQVRAEEGVTKWVTGFRINIRSDNFNLGSNDFERFGGIAGGLTNGLEIFVTQGGSRVDVTAEPIQIAGDFLNYADDFTNFVNAIGSQGDFLQTIYRFDQPVVLPAGTVDTITIRVQDDFTTAISVGGGTAVMNAIARGYQESTT